jgi:hypothetical protein
VNEPSARGQATRRLTLAVGAERSVARFRLVSAFVVLPASIYVLARPSPLPAKTFAVLGVLACLGFVASFFRARARIRGRDAFHLDLADDGMTLCLGAAPTYVAWSEIVDVDVDEDRLMVVMRLRDGRFVDVPPSWEGVGLYELAASLRERKGRCIAPG